MLRPARAAIAVTVLAVAATACAAEQPDAATGGAGQLASIEIVTTTVAAERATAEQTGADLDGEPATAPTARYSVVAQATAAEVVARTEPSAEGSVVAALPNPTASGAPLVFRAVDDGPSSPEWIEVHLPIEPNGSTGWVRRDEVSLSNNPYRVEIERASHRLRVYDLDTLITEAPIAVGTGATPTPVGEFYLLELLVPPEQDGPYGPFAFGLSGFSEVLDSFGGVDQAIIGLHGTNDPSSLGTDVSHGCIRLANDVITELATTLPLGTPVVIT